IVDGDLVPLADARRVGFGDIDGAIVAQLLLRVRIVHHGNPTQGAVVVVVAEAEGVADFVGGELADAGEGGLVKDGGPLVAGVVGGKQALEDEVVLAVAEGAEGDGGLDDLAGARVGDGAAHAPAAGGAVDPVDHVVADVHGVGAVGEDGDLEGVAESGGFEGLVPPTGAFDEGAADVLGRAGVDPILDGLDGVGDGGGGILFLEAVAAQVALDHGFADGGAVVDEGETAVAGPRVVVAGLVIGVGQFDQGIVFAQGDGFGGGSDASDGAGEESAAAPAASSGTGCAWGGGGGDDDGGRSLVGAGATAAASAAGLI